MNATGTGALPNTAQGITLRSGSTGNFIGGTVLLARNVISGNTQSDSSLSQGGSHFVQANFIGTDFTGNATIANGEGGVRLNGQTKNNLIGGTTPAARNIISGNFTSFVTISANGTTGNKVQGNFIGIGADGTTPLGNVRRGVFIHTLAANNLIGGPTGGSGNIIANNGEDGVLIGSDGRGWEHLRILAGTRCELRQPGQVASKWSTKCLRGSIVVKSRFGFRNSGRC